MIKLDEIIEIGEATKWKIIERKEGKGGEKIKKANNYRIDFLYECVPYIGNNPNILIEFPHLTQFEQKYKCRIKIKYENYLRLLLLTMRCFP